MRRLARGICIAVVEEFGPEELVKRLSDPVWFQSLGCVMGFDYNSSGLTTITMGAFKEGIRGIESHLGVFAAGGKGGTSKKTPAQIQNWGMFLGWPMERIDRLVYASKMAARVDSSVLQDGFNIYTHSFVFTKQGTWTVVQQGMNTVVQKARRYHWWSPSIQDFVEEPHTAVISSAKVRPLNLTAHESRQNRETSFGLVKEEPAVLMRDVKTVVGADKGTLERRLSTARRQGQMTLLDMENVEFSWHPVAQESFNVKRLEKTLTIATQSDLKDFENLVALRGVGPRTIRALSLVSELIYGAKPSYEDPARYTFAHGGKDGTPFPVDRKTYDTLLQIMERGIKKSGMNVRERDKALVRLNKTPLLS